MVISLNTPGRTSIVGGTKFGYSNSIFCSLPLLKLFTVTASGVRLASAIAPSRYLCHLIPLEVDSWKYLSPEGQPANSSGGAHASKISSKIGVSKPLCKNTAPASYWDSAYRLASSSVSYSRRDKVVEESGRYTYFISTGSPPSFKQDTSCCQEEKLRGSPS